MKRLLVFLFVMFFAVNAYATSDYLVKGIVNPEYPLCDAWINEYNALGVVIVSKDVGVTGTGLIAFVSADHGALGGCKLSGDSIAVMKIIITPLPSNTLPVWVGSSIVSKDSGFPLSTDSAIPLTLEVDNVQDVYISSEIPGEGVGWVGITR